MCPIAVQSPPLTLSEYATAAEQTDQFVSDSVRLRMLEFGFFGEIGGLLAAIKKVGRDQLKQSDSEVAAEEIGDALWYLLSVAKVSGVSADDLGSACMRELRLHFNESVRDVLEATSFQNIDGIIAMHAPKAADTRPELLGELAGLTGDLLVSRQPRLYPDQFPRRPTEFGKILAALALVTASFNLKLEELARSNLRKIHARWPGATPSYTNLFDIGYPAHEQLPRQFDIKFIERGRGAAAHVVQELNGVFIGDPLTDNSVEEDDYRFHDVFHLAYAAHLGWSPVLRALLKRKRKSDRRVDEKQDGARAMIIEEGIVTWIFNHAKKRDFYEGVSEDKLEYGLLKQVTAMVEGYEVDRCPPWQWARAILAGFEIFREMRLPSNRGGTVSVDMDKHTIKFSNEGKKP
jgi:NTP pyrophosphatase (non-canonical NTP hydrolase)